jgi:hypothetical protein
VKRGQIAPADWAQLRAWLARFAGRDDVAFALEACTGWRYVAEELAGAGVAADIANLVAFLVSEGSRWSNGQVIRANGVIGSQTQGHGPGISRVRGTARSATLIRSTSTPGGHHEHH